MGDGRRREEEREMDFERLNYNLFGQLLFLLLRHLIRKSFQSEEIVSKSAE